MRIRQFNFTATPITDKTLSFSGDNVKFASLTDNAQLVTVNGTSNDTASDKVSIVATNYYDITNSVETDSTLYFGLDGNTTNILSGSVTVGHSSDEVTLQNGTVVHDNSLLDIAAGTLKVTNGVSLLGHATAEVSEGATLQTDTMTISSTSEATNGAELSVDGTLKGLHNDGVKLDATGKTITVGHSNSTNSTDSAKGTLIVDEESTLTGASIFVDPAWNGSDTISDASNFAYGSTDPDDTSTTVDYKLTIGQNSVGSLGTTSTSTAAKLFDTSTYKWGDDDISAALYLAKPTYLSSGSGGIKVDGSLTTDNLGKTGYEAATANNATFGDNSLLMVETRALNGNAALNGDASSTVTSTLTVGNNASLLLSADVLGDVGGTKSYGIYSNFTTANSTNTTDTNWLNNTNNISFDNKLLMASKAPGANNGSVEVTRLSTASVLPSAVLPNVIDHVDLTRDTTHPGIKYLYDATSTGLTDTESTDMINFAAQAGEIAGATATTVLGATELTDTAQQHFSWLSGSKKRHGDDFWFKYLYNKTDFDGLSLDNFHGADYDTKLNGAILGCDLRSVGDYRQGVAIAYGDGSTDGSLANDDYKLWTLSYYGSLMRDKNNLLFDVSYGRARHDVDAYYAGRHFEMEPKHNIFSIGVTDEYKIRSGKTNIIPHIGLRYMNINADDYDATIGGTRAFHYDPGTQSLVALPVGVGFMNVTKSGAWIYRF